MNPGYAFSIQVCEKARELGYAPSELPMLLLVPFVKVAWAEGFVQTKEQKAILNFAENFRIVPEHPNYGRLLGWFEERPTDEFFARSIEDLSALLASIPPKQAARLRSILQLGCLEVAHASGDIGLLRGRSNVRREEREALLHIGERLGLSQGYV